MSEKLVNDIIDRLFRDDYKPRSNIGGRGKPSDARRRRNRDMKRLARMLESTKQETDLYASPNPSKAPL